MTRKDFEIMAPVGSRESLAAAIKAGADSIYFGIENLNMRAHSASTFTIDDLKEMAQTCAAHGIKSYLTVNTIIYGEDLPLMRTIIDAAKEADISAVIASDVAVMMYCRQIGQEVHLSTQLNISNIEALKFYAQFADVVVLARELNMTQVADIHRQIEEQRICGPGGELIRIEMFCHGALCMAVSGKCYLSLDNTGRSANRGACMQICRRGYIVKDRETGTELEIDNKYIMSPKDLKTVRFIDRMMEAYACSKSRDVPGDRNMWPPSWAAIRKPYKACWTGRSPKRKKTDGTRGWPACSTVVSGTGTTRDRL